MDISGKTAIVTGAASGIGLGIATALAEAGANVVMADIQKDVGRAGGPLVSPSTNKQRHAGADRCHAGAIRARCSGGSRTQFRQTPHRLQQCRACRCTAPDCSMCRSGDWEFVIGVNIWGVIHGIRHFVPAILRHGEEGHIVNTGLGRRLSEPPRHQPGAVFDEQIRRSFTVRGTGARTGRHQCRRLGTMPGADQHEYRARRPQPPGPHGAACKFRASEEAVLAERLATTGLDPKKVGERVVDAIRTRPLVPNMKYRPSPAIIGLPLCNCSRLIPG